MLKFLLLTCFVGIGLAHPPDVAVRDQRLANGDEDEMVSVDLKTLGGDKEVYMTADLRVHLIQGQVHVNGHPVVHNIVNKIHMLVSIIEVVNGVKGEARFTPVVFRVFVRAIAGSNGGDDRLITEVEFNEVEENEVHQVDVTQIIWEGSNRLPVTSISTEDSVIRQKSPDDDKHVYVKPHHGPFPPHRHDMRGRHGKGDKPHRCWYHHLGPRAKMAVIGAAVLCLIIMLVLTIICWRRRRVNRLKVDVPKPNSVEVQTEKDDEKKFPINDGEFHMEVNHAYVGDKVDLIVD